MKSSKSIKLVPAKKEQLTKGSKVFTSKTSTTPATISEVRTKGRSTKYVVNGEEVGIKNLFVMSVVDGKTVLPVKFSRIDRAVRLMKEGITDSLRYEKVTLPNGLAVAKV